MKILYAIQGTGNGHFSRARDIVPILLNKNIELDILVSGTQADIALGHPVSYQLKGLSFVFGTKGGIDFWKTYVKANSRRLQKEISSLPIEKYDFVINDFEPVSAWACRLKNKACISLSHQAAVLAEKSPKPRKKDPFGEFVLRNYAPSTSNYGFHFRAYQKNVFTPVVRRDIRQATKSNDGHYTVYLPAFSDEKIINILSEFPGTKWEVFSKHGHTTFKSNHISLRPVSNKAFVDSMVSSKGIFCGAGFETPSEALYLQKKLMVLPMKGQYEQQCNAVALKEMGVTVLKSLKRKNLEKIEQWLNSDKLVSVDYPDNTEVVVDLILKEANVAEAILV